MRYINVKAINGSKLPVTLKRVTRPVDWFFCPHSHSTVGSTSQAALTRQIRISDVTCLVFSDQVYLEILASVVDTLPHPDTNSTGVG
jgi:hypothetical protein